MLSILIPTYNFDCSKLIGDLLQQAEGLSLKYDDFQYEIIVVDDASSHRDATHEIAQLAKSHEALQYVCLETNAGRSAVRNLLTDLAHGEWILMLDDDAEVIKDDFLAHYWRCRTKADVLCGDLMNPKEVLKGHELRFKYEWAAMPQRAVNVRNKAPYDRFTTFNFFAKKSVIKAIGFNTSIKEYGYEDVLLGLELKARGARILHLDNPLLHLGIDANDVFVMKTEASLRSFATLPESYKQQTKLGRTLRKLNQLKLKGLAAALLKPWLPAMKRNLLSHQPNLFVFKLYKLTLAIIQK
ncbi:MAG: glycosyltransferase family 2 protein [Bacteroidaceae bacterium]|nr:glycosyltransferase family 2 protein [Bacteroidaceae bacterium]